VPAPSRRGLLLGPSMRILAFAVIDFIIYSDFISRRNGMSWPSGTGIGLADRLMASSNPTPARYRRRPCGVAWMPFRNLIVEYINKWYFFNIQMKPIKPLMKTF
jgi:hypothetical protein